MNIQSTVTFLLLALWSCIALAQELVPQESDVPTKLPPTADSVIARFVEAKGGKEKLSSILSYSLSGVIEIVNEDEREEFGEFQIYQTDGQSLTRITLPDSSVMSHGTEEKSLGRSQSTALPVFLKGERRVTSFAITKHFMGHLLGLNNSRRLDTWVIKQLTATRLVILFSSNRTIGKSTATSL